MVTSKGSNIEFELCPAGTHQAVCVAIFDLGLQRGSYNGIENIMPKVVIQWEIDQKRKDGKRFLLSKFYTNSISPKATLRGDLVPWRGRDFSDEEMAGFDLDSLIGKNCLLSVIHEDRNGKNVAKIVSISSLPSSMNKITAETTYTEDPEWIKKFQAKQVKEGDIVQQKHEEEDLSEVPF